MTCRTKLLSLPILCLAVCLLSSQSGKAQIYSQFMKHYEGGDVEYGYGVAEATDGNFVVCGNIGFGPGGADACVMNLDPAGNQLWTLAYGGNSGEDARAIAVTRDSGFIFVGETNSFGAGGADVLVAKLDPFGAVQWARAIGGAGNDYGMGVDTTTDGGYIVGGYTRSFGAGLYDTYFIKLSAGGNVQWTRTVGGTANDLIFDVVQTPDGGYAGAGYTGSFGAPANNYLLVRLNAAGNLVNATSYGGGSSDNGFGLISTGDGGLMLYGYTSTFGTGGNEGMLIKTDENGNLSWARTYGSPAMDRIFHVVEQEPGRYVATGETTTNTFGAGDQQVFKVDASGDLVWARHYGTPVDETGYGASVRTRDGGIILSAWDDNAEDFLVTKMDSLGDSGCNNALSNLTVTTPALVIATGGVSGSGGIETNVALPFSANPLIEIPYCSILLPVGDVRLFAESRGPQNLIRWEIGEPAELSGLCLERSFDGRLFEERHVPVQILADGSYLDPVDEEGVWYYRLALRDMDGKVHHSAIKRVLSELHSVTLRWSFGGVREGARRVEGLSPELGMDWQLLDVRGKLLREGRAGEESGAVWELGTWPDGIYILRIQQAGRPYALKIVHSGR